MNHDLPDGPNFDRLCRDVNNAGGYTLDQFLGDCVAYADQSGGWLLAYTPHVQAAWDRGWRSPKQAVDLARHKARKHEVATLQQHGNASGPEMIDFQDFDEVPDPNEGRSVAYVLIGAMIVATVIVCYFLRLVAG